MSTQITDYADFVATSLTRVRPRIAGLRIERLSRTRLKVSFRVDGRDESFRLLMFAVGGTGRGNAEERRIEITSTYEAGILPDSSSRDIVLGVERELRLLVGVDARRLNFGGETANASTFVYPAGFSSLSNAASYNVISTPSKIIPNERQIYIRPSHLHRYLAKANEVHDIGISALSAAGQGQQLSSPDISPDQPDPLKPGVTLPYSEQVKLALLKMEVGQAGERKAFARERQMLTANAHPKLASKVKWISQTHPYAGYDISSFGLNGTVMLVEVKSSTGALRSFHFTHNECRLAEKTKDRYKIVCVSDVFGKPSFYEILNPFEKIEANKLRSRPDGYLVTL